MDGVSSVTLQNSTAASSTGGNTGGTCPTGYPTFTLQMVFLALPAPSAASSAKPKSAGGA
jgi:hypothetical protein